MRIVYFGDGTWAVKCLQRLLQEGHEVLGVVVRCRPSDESLGEFTRQIGIAARSPNQVNAPEFVGWVRSLKPELNISMSYDQILEEPILESAPIGFINCHAGKLPHYRGRNVINWAIINNEKEIGLTIHYVDEGIDTGDIILQRTLTIDWEDTYGTMLRKIEEAFPGLLAQAVRLIEKDEVDRQHQELLTGTYFSRRIQGDEWIDWRDSSLNVYNKIRAITRPGPGARTLLDNRELIVWQAHYDPNWPEYIAKPGEVVGVIPNRGVQVKTGDSTLILESVQFAGGSEHTPRFGVGTRLGLDPVQTMHTLRQEIERLRNMVAGGTGVKNGRVD